MMRCVLGSWASPARILTRWRENHIGGGGGGLLRGMEKTLANSTYLFFRTEVGICKRELSLLLPRGGLDVSMSRCSSLTSPYVCAGVS